MPLVFSEELEQKRKLGRPVGMVNLVVARKRAQKRFWVRVKKTSGCWFWVGLKNRGGYGTFWTNRKYWKAHRYSWFLKFGDIENCLHVLHKCDIRNCVNPDHLFLGTNYDNVQDCIKKSRSRKCFGENQHLSKLKESD